MDEHKIIKTGLDLRNFRKSLGLTQTEFAHECGYKTYHHISDMERGVAALSAKAILTAMRLQNNQKLRRRRIKKMSSPESK